MPTERSWSHTVIGGRTARYDFHARDGEINIGRIYQHSGTFIPASASIAVTGVAIVLSVQSPPSLPKRRRTTR